MDYGLAVLMKQIRAVQKCLSQGKCLIDNIFTFFYYLFALYTYKLESLKS